MENSNDIRFHISVETNQCTLDALGNVLQRIFPALQASEVQKAPGSNGSTKPKASTPPLLESRKCKWCSNVFTPKTTNQVYHSQQCQEKAQKYRAAERAVERNGQVDSQQSAA